MVQASGETTYRSVEAYLKSMEKRRALEESPLACVVMLGGPALLTHEEAGHPWLNRVRCELPQRPLGPGGIEEPVRACYIGANNADEDAAQFELVQQALGGVGVAHTGWLRVATPTSAALANLEQADIVVLGDGPHHEAAWREMNDGPDGIAERIRWRYYQGAVLLGVGSGAMLLGKHGHAHKPPSPPAVLPGEATGGDSTLAIDGDGDATTGDGAGGGGAATAAELSTYKAFEIVPAVIGVDEGLLQEAVEQLGHGTLAFALPLRGGFLFNTDATFEAAHGFVTEIRLSWSQGGGGGGSSRDLDSILPVSRSLIVPPPTDETVVVCTRWLRAKGRDGAPPQASAAADAADAADAAAEEADAAEVAQERSEAERALGLLPLRSAAAAAAAASEAAGHRASGGEAYRRGDHAAALRCFEAGARADPRCVLSALNRSAALLKLARHRDALLAADRALWLSNGSSAKAYYRRAAAFTAAGDFNEALCDLEAAKVLEPADAAVAAARAKALEAREEACWSFAAACKATPPLPCVALMDELEQFDGEEVELHDGRLALRWGPDPDADGKERPEVAREEAGPLDGRALWALEAATKRRALHVLSLRGCGLGPWGAHFVASGVRATGGASSLETLRLSACRLRADGCAAVASLLTLDGFAAARARSLNPPQSSPPPPPPHRPRPPSQP